MKKFFAFICIVTLIACGLTSALADEKTPWNSEGMKVHIYEDFSSQGNIDVDQFTQGFVLESDAITHFMRIKDGKFDFYAGGSGNMYFNYALNISQESKDQFQYASGVGFYVENNTAGDIILGWQSKNSENKQHICTGIVYCYDIEFDDFYIADTDDTWDVHCMPYIPSGFKGYVIFPFSSLSYRENGVWTEWASDDFIDSIGLIVRGGVLNEEENMIIDNLFVYGENVLDNNNGRVVFNSSDVTPTPSETTTSAAPGETNASVAPDETVTPAPTDNEAIPTNDSSTQEPTPTPSDSTAQPNNNMTVIYIIIGVVVVAGVVAIILVAKKKK